MAIEIRGRFVTLACALLETKPAARDAAMKFVLDTTGLNFDKLEPAGWYPVALFSGIFDIITRQTSPILAKASLKTIGSKVYPTIKAHGGIPSDINTPSALLAFEAKGFLDSFHGVGVVPRKIIKDTPKEFVVQADMPSGIPKELMEGVYQGILQMCGVSIGKVSVNESTGHCVYRVSWS